MSLLHHLPAELVREILEMLDPASFYLCLQTSKLFREHARKSAKLLREQLARIPGPRLTAPLMAGDGNALMQEFNKRAAKHLVIGVPWMADKHMWHSYARIDRKNSTLVRWGWDTKGNSIGNMDIHPFQECLVLLEVLSDNATVKIYIVEEHEKYGFCPRLKHIISPHCLSQQLLVCSQHLVRMRYEVLKVALCMQNSSDKDNDNSDLMVSVLYKVRQPCICTKVWMKLLVFRLDATFGPLVVESFDIEEHRHEQVVAMAMTRSDEAIIVVRHFQLEIHKVVVYRIEKDETTLEKGIIQEHRTICPSLRSAGERVASISVYGRTVHFYPSTFPIPHWTISQLSNLTSHIEQFIERRNTTLPAAVSYFVKHSLGKAIAHHHHHMITDSDLNDSEPICVNTALELVISRCDESDSRNGTDINSSRTGAFLLKALDYSTTCKTFDLSKHYPSLHHVFVAQLAGLPDLHNLSTLGLRIAVSPRAHRIAIASWKTVKVWSLDPEAFLNPEYSLAGAPGVPGDYVFIQGCAWQFYCSGSFENECVMLVPEELPSAGVVYDLQFRNEDELWGWTGPGLCRWRFGVDARARDDVSLLEEESDEDIKLKRSG